MTVDTQKLRELLEKATPGPWHVVAMPGWGGISIGRRPQDEASKTAGDAPIAKVVDRAPHWENCFPVEANAQLIAAARNALPALLAENEALRAEKERTERNRDMWKGQCERQAKQLQATRWQPIETAPHETLVVLGWHDENGVFKQEIALASAGTRYPGGASDMWWHGRATHWMPLDRPPAPPQGDGA